MDTDERLLQLQRDTEDDDQRLREERAQERRASADEWMGNAEEWAREVEERRLMMGTKDFVMALMLGSLEMDDPGFALWEAADSLKDDKEIVLAAMLGKQCAEYMGNIGDTVSSNANQTSGPGSLSLDLSAVCWQAYTRYASPALRADLTLATLACEANGFVIGLLVADDEVVSAMDNQGVLGTKLQIRRDVENPNRATSGAEEFQLMEEVAELSYLQNHYSNRWLAERETLKQTVLDSEFVFLAAMRSGTRDSKSPASGKPVGLMLEHVSERLKNKRETVLASIEASEGMSLQFAGAELQADREVVLKAISLSAGYAFEFADDGLKADEDVALAAIKALGDSYSSSGPRRIGNAGRYLETGSLTHPLYHMPREVRRNKKIILACCSGSGSQINPGEHCFGHAMAALEELEGDQAVLNWLNDKGVMALLTGGEEKMPEIAYLHKEYALKAVTHVNAYPKAFLKCSEALRDDKEVVLAAIRTNENFQCYEHASDRLKRDREVRKAAGVKTWCC
jgi:hypothetical protein